MKNLAINFQVEEKDVRAAFAMLTGEALSDAQLEEFFINPIDLPMHEVLEESAQQMILIFIALISDKKRLV